MNTVDRQFFNSPFLWRPPCHNLSHHELPGTTSFHPKSRSHLQWRCAVVQHHKICNKFEWKGAEFRPCWNTVMAKMQTSWRRGWLELQQQKLLDHTWPIVLQCFAKLLDKQRHLALSSSIRNWSGLGRACKRIAELYLLQLLAARDSATLDKTIIISVNTSASPRPYNAILCQKNGLWIIVTISLAFRWEDASPVIMIHSRSLVIIVSFRAIVIKAV